ncbi:MAG TPA: YciI family protein [Ardenticatenaceae bacterium]|nr:YciI family protein [Ardenticatenaceae bacterium]
MAQYMLFIRGGSDPEASETPEEMQRIIERYRAWAGSLRSQGKLVAADKLKDGEGRLLSVRNGEIVVDGPFAETKETIGGYFTVEAADYNEAVELARGCPVFERGGSIELREIEAT